MNATLSTLKFAGRAALVALTIGGAAATAMPAQAQSFNFQLGVGSDGNVMSFGLGTNDYKKNYHPIKKCLKDWQIESALEDYGWRNVDVYDHLGHMQVAATGDWKMRSYAMKVDACSGKVYDVTRIYKSKGNGGFGFEFHLGN